MPAACRGTAAELRRLPGIGRYTAAAIASIAFNEPAAVVDGNVQRILGRLLGRRFSPAVAWPEAQRLLDESRPGDWNQAMMELGAVICTPRQPACPGCPLRPWCATQGAEAPRKAVARRRRTIYHALAVRAGRVYLARRAKDAKRMPGMWELPACGPRRRGNASAAPLHY